jgi:hypothetical protein
LSGDSLLFQYGPRIQQLADDGTLAANTWFVSGGNCAPLPGTIQRDDFAHCANIAGVLTDLVRREKIQSVVLGASWAGYGGDGFKIERNGKQFSMPGEGADAFYANLEDFVRVLQGNGAHVYLVLGVPVQVNRFNPSKMVKRGLTGFSVARDVEADVATTELRGVYATIDERLRGIAQRTGAIILDVFTTTPFVVGSS